MSAETESIVLGVIALFAAVGTAVAIRRKTAKSAVACCIVVGGALLLYGELDHEAKREADRQAQWRERQEQWRVSNPNPPTSDERSITIPNELKVDPEGGHGLGRQRIHGEMRSFTEPESDGVYRRIPRRKHLPVSPAAGPGRQPSDDGLTP